MTDQELKDLVASLAISQAKTDKMIKELFESQAKTDKQLKETDEMMKRQIKELFESQAKTDEMIKKISEQIGGIGNNQGAVAEEYFYNSLKKKMKLLNMKFDDIGLNWTRSKRGLQDEFDIILINGKSVALIEVKYKAHKNDIEKLDKKIKNFKKLFTEYSHLKLYAGIASFNIYEEAKELAKQKGYFVLKRNGNVIEEYVADSLKAV